MNEQIKTAMTAARAYYEASEAFNTAKEALMPFAKQQIEITKHVALEFNMKDNYTYRPFFYYDWIEFGISSYYEGASDTPMIECNLWYRGRYGEFDSVEGSFNLSGHIINGESEKFEAELRAKLEYEGQKKAIQEREVKERQIAQLQADLANLQGETK